MEKLDIYNGSHHNNNNTEKNFWCVGWWEIYREKKEA